MIPDDLYESIANVFKNTIQELKDEIDEMHEFFKSMRDPIIWKAVKNVEKTLRRFPEEARQFGDDSKLNFFEEVCVMEREGSMVYYQMVYETIEMCCQDAFEELTDDEQFILLHVDERLSVDLVVDYIKSEFLQYCLNYENKRIENAYYNRN